jgi:formate hydrogenlyase subunit 6/NADH:ubiquinone oxidoreductase subunit I
MAHLKITGLVLKSAMRKPATRRYPFEKREPFAGTRGSIRYELSKCTFCMLCQKKCPTGTITVKRQERIYEFDRLKCIVCGACVEVCPKDALHMDPKWAPPRTDRKVEIYKGEPLPPSSAAPKA